jgi:hypothetical protein
MRATRPHVRDPGMVAMLWTWCHEVSSLTSRSRRDTRHKRAEGAVVTPLPGAARGWHPPPQARRRPPGRHGWTGGGAPTRRAPAPTGPPPPPPRGPRRAGPTGAAVAWAPGLA